MHFNIDGLAGVLIRAQRKGSGLAFCIVNPASTTTQNDKVGREPARCPLGSDLAVCRRFRLRARLVLAVSPFPAPARSNRACGFPAHGSPVRFTPGVMGRITLAALSDVAHG